MPATMADVSNVLIIDDDPDLPGLGRASVAIARPEILSYSRSISDFLESEPSRGSYLPGARCETARGKRS